LYQRSGRDFKGWHINTEINTEQPTQQMRRHLRDDSRGHAEDCFSEQAFNITASILDFMEDTLNTFPDAAQPTIEAGRVLIVLIGDLVQQLNYDIGNLLSSILAGIAISTNDR
jgi:hypothetical protein